MADTRIYLDIPTVSICSRFDRLSSATLLLATFSLFFRPALIYTESRCVCDPSPSTYFYITLSCSCNGVLALHHHSRPPEVGSLMGVKTYYGTTTTPDASREILPIDFHPPASTGPNFFLMRFKFFRSCPFFSNGRAIKILFPESRGKLTSGANVQETINLFRGERSFNKARGRELLISSWIGFKGD